MEIFQQTQTVDGFGCESNDGSRLSFPPLMNGQMGYERVGSGGEQTTSNLLYTQFGSCGIEWAMRDGIKILAVLLDNLVAS